MVLDNKLNWEDHNNEICKPLLNTYFTKKTEIFSSTNLDLLITAHFSFLCEPNLCRITMDGV